MTWPARPRPRHRGLPPWRRPPCGRQARASASCLRAWITRLVRAGMRSGCPIAGEAERCRSWPLRPARGEPGSCIRGARDRLSSAERSGAKPTAHSSALLALIGARRSRSASRRGVWASLRPAYHGAATDCVRSKVRRGGTALGIGTFDVVNIAETSLHMHLLLELALGWSGAAGDLLERYSADRMIAARLERLASLGQLRIVNGRCYVANRSTLPGGRHRRVAHCFGLLTSPTSLTNPPGAFIEPPGADRGGRR